MTFSRDRLSHMAPHTVALAILALFLSAPTGSAASLWDHNGSTVHLEAAGASRKFYYETPRSDLPVTRGTLLFQGSRSGKRYSGSAYVFSAGCGTFGYSVRGTVSADERSVSLYGKAPRVGPDCNVIGYQDDILVFTPKGSQPGGSSQPLSPDGRLFSLERDEYYLLSSDPYTSEDSGGYEGRLRVRKQYQNGGYEIQLMEYTARCNAPFDNMVYVTIREAGSDDYISGRTDIESPDKHPGPRKKTAYNLYWAVCRGLFRKFK